MKTDPLRDLLEDLGKIFDLPLEPDRKNSCSIVIDEKFKIQMELNHLQDKLIVGAYLGVVPPGRFRENLLAHALKANAVYPRIGTLGYSPYHNQLALFDFLILEGLNGDKLADSLGLFIAKGNEWIEALKTGILPQLTTPPEPLKPPLR